MMLLTVHVFSTRGVDIDLLSPSLQCDPYQKLSEMIPIVM